MKNKQFKPFNIEQKEKTDEEGEGEEEDDDIHMNEKAICKVCKKDGKCKKISIPFVLRFLTNELASMGIKLKYTVKDL
jgi:DNA-directed RNA polymerase beta subunit